MEHYSMNALKTAYAKYFTDYGDYSECTHLTVKNFIVRNSVVILTQEICTNIKCNLKPFRSIHLKSLKAVIQIKTKTRIFVNNLRNFPPSFKQFFFLRRDKIINITNF